MNSHPDADVIELQIWGLGRGARQAAYQIFTDIPGAHLDLITRRWWQLADRHVITWPYSAERHARVDGWLWARHVFANYNTRRRVIRHAAN